jgi:hypothetical protein
MFSMSALNSLGSLSYLTSDFALSFGTTVQEDQAVIVLRGTPSGRLYGRRLFPPIKKFARMFVAYPATNGEVQFVQFPS